MPLFNLPRKRRSKTYRAKGLPPQRWAEANDRQELVDGSEFERKQHAKLLIVGGGGIGSNVAHAAMRTGYGHVTNMDDDIVDISNLPRQLFLRSDVGKFKSHAIGRQLERTAIFPFTFVADPHRFQERYSLEQAPRDRPDAIIAGPDNTPTRRYIAEFGITHAIPVIHAAVGRDANALYVLVQEPGHACFGCAFPHMLDDRSYPCGLPGILDVLLVLTGHIMHATDSLICGRPREWNYRQVYLDGALPDRTHCVERRADCPLCATPVPLQPAA